MSDPSDKSKKAHYDIKNNNHETFTNLSYNGDTKDITLDECQEAVFFDHATRDWDDIANYTFHGRVHEEETLRKAIKEALFTSRNVIIVGGAGHGKSTLIKKVVKDHPIELDHTISLRYEYINLRTLGPEIDERKFFETANTPLKSILEHLGIKPPPFDGNVPPNEVFRRLCENLIHADIQKLKEGGKSAVLIVDDVDYIEYGCHRLLIDNLRPLLASPNITIVWACRPSALAELQYEFSNRGNMYFVREDPVILPPPAIREVIVGRIWPFLNKEMCTKDICDQIETIASRERYIKWPKHLAIFVKQKLGSIFSDRYRQIPYPLETWEDFIMTASNGDLRVIFGMVAQVVRAVQQNPGNFIPEMNRTGHALPIQIKRKDFLKMLGMGNKSSNPVLPEQEKDLWQLLNMFEKTNKTRKSPLYVNVLQWIALRREHFDEEYVNTMKKLGFSEYDAREGAEYCKRAMLIEPEVISTGSYRVIDSNLPMRRRWQLTWKGSYYLREVIEWPEYEYAKPFGDYPCIFDDLDDSQLSYDIVEFLGLMVIADRAIKDIVTEMFNFQGDKGYLCLPSKKLQKVFLSVYGQYYTGRHRHDPLEDGVPPAISNKRVHWAIAKSCEQGNKGEKLLRAKEGDKLSKDKIGMYKFSRNAILNACKYRQVLVPNHARIDPSIYLNFVYKEIWHDRVKDHLKEGHTHEEVLKKALCVLQERPRVSP
jgi:hypothetical protein